MVTNIFVFATDFWHCPESILVWSMGGDRSAYGNIRNEHCPLQRK